LDGIKESIMSEGPVAAIIRAKLTEGLAPRRLEIEDDSWRHAGHHHEGGMDAKPGGESHFNLVIVSETFQGQSRGQCAAEDRTGRAGPRPVDQGPDAGRGWGRKNNVHIVLEPSS
jgi:stress-induced morphogen